MNLMRAILASCAAIAAIFAAAFGMWTVAGVLLVAVACHIAMWVYQYRSPHRPALPPR
ncbi:MAG TPA: hypothetical protein VIK95_04980 [Egibacteraceae bacterium]